MGRVCDISGKPGDKQLDLLIVWVGKMDEIKRWLDRISNGEVETWTPERQAAYLKRVHPGLVVDFYRFLN